MNTDVLSALYADRIGIEVSRLIKEGKPFDPLGEIEHLSQVLYDSIAYVHPTFGPTYAELHDEEREMYRYCVRQLLNELPEDADMLDRIFRIAETNQ